MLLFTAKNLYAVAGGSLVGTVIGGYNGYTEAKQDQTQCLANKKEEKNNTPKFTP
ncbi:MAG: hypothetical protein ACR2HS_06595 [Gammaproteobacteria bacterium]